MKEAIGKMILIGMKIGIFIMTGKMITKGRGKREEGRGKREEGRGKREEGRGKREEGRGKREFFAFPCRAGEKSHQNKSDFSDQLTRKIVDYD
jgi:hypothetical protein